MIINVARLEVRVPAQQREQLVRLARDTGMTVPGLVRLATQRLLDDRASLLRGSNHEREGVSCPVKPCAMTATPRAAISPLRTFAHIVTVWNDPATPGIKVVRAGTLDNMDWAEPIGNIWTDSKAASVKIDPKLTNFPKQAVDRTPLFDAWTRHNQG